MIKEYQAGSISSLRVKFETNECYHFTYLQKTMQEIASKVNLEIMHNGVLPLLRFHQFSKNEEMLNFDQLF